MINLTQHLATEEQKSVGVIDLDESLRTALTELLTFTEPPTPEEMNNRAEAIARLAINFRDDRNVMIGGAPFFMGILASTIKGFGLNPFYAFSERVVLEDVNGKKTSVFRHKAFIPHY